MFKVSDKYIAKEFVKYFLLSLITVLCLFIVIDFINKMVRFNAPITLLAKFYLYFSFEILHQMVPLACLAGSLFTFSSLNNSRELLALFSSGVSLLRLSVPVLFLVGIICGGAFFFSDRLLPKIIQKKNYIYYVDIKKKPGLFSTVKKDKIWYRLKDMIVNISTLNIDKKIAHGVSLYYFTKEWDLEKIITAKKAQFSGPQWKLMDGDFTRFVGERGVPEKLDFTEKTIQLDEQFIDIQSSSHVFGALSIKELRSYITKNNSAGLDTNSYEVDLHSKYSFALAGLVLALLAIPFTVTNTRKSGNAMVIGACIFFAFIYWIIYSLGLSMGKYGTLPPWLAAWMANIIIAILGLFLIARLKK